MGKYSKLFGALSGPVAALAVSAGIPAQFVQPEMLIAAAGLVSGFATYFFPANR